MRKKTTEIRIRPYKGNDLKILSEIRNNQKIQVLLITHPLPNSRAKVKKWIEQKSFSNDTAFFVITDMSDSAVGFIQASRIDLINRHCYVGIAVHPDFQGRQVFSQAYFLFEQHLIRYFNIRKLIAEILSFNAVSLKAFFKVGFHEAGILKSHYYLDRKYHDVVLMEKLINLKSE